MNIAGVIKDWILIFWSAYLFVTPISALNLVGYTLAFLAVGVYNYAKLQEMKVEQRGSAASALSGGSGGAVGGGGAGLGGGALAIGSQLPLPLGQDSAAGGGGRLDVESARPGGPGGADKSS